MTGWHASARIPHVQVPADLHLKTRLTDGAPTTIAACGSYNLKSANRGMRRCTEPSAAQTLDHA